MAVLNECRIKDGVVHAVYLEPMAAEQAANDVLSSLQDLVQGFDISLIFGVLDDGAGYYVLLRDPSNTVTANMGSWVAIHGAAPMVWSDADFRLLFSVD
jgi:hypothetical protein